MVSRIFQKYPSKKIQNYFKNCSNIVTNALKFYLKFFLIVFFFKMCWNLISKLSELCLNSLRVKSFKIVSQFLKYFKFWFQKFQNFVWIGCVKFFKIVSQNFLVLPNKCFKSLPHDVMSVSKLFFKIFPIISQKL